MFRHPRRLRWRLLWMSFPAPQGKFFFGIIALDLDDLRRQLGRSSRLATVARNAKGAPGLTTFESKGAEFFAVELEAHL